MRDNPRIFTVELGQDDPSKCTSAKMRRFRLARQISIRQIPRAALVLNPMGPLYISRAERESAVQHGLVVVDCSWERADSTLTRKLKGEQRKLPLLLAGNPTNYSIAGKLSSVEAVGAALFIMGFEELSKSALSLYKWGQTFLSLNEAPLKDYSSAENQEKIRQLEREYFPHLSND
jgi:pre-rRNA-processing protein TSR3